METRTPAGFPWRRMLCWVIAGIACFLLVHNHALNLLPDTVRVLESGAMMRAQPSRLPIATVALPDWPADDRTSQRSRLRLFENGRPLSRKIPFLDPVLDSPDRYWTHQKGRVYWAASDGTDPKSNGRTYSLHHPIGYGKWWSRGALVAMVCALVGLWRWKTEAPGVVPGAGVPKFHRATFLAGLSVFLAGLYCNTGTLAPYALTHLPIVDPGTGYAYHIDHPQHRATYELLRGSDRELWEDSVLLRRILYAILAWPFTIGLGFEVGGVLAGLFWNLIGFGAWVWWVRARWGEAVAMKALWLGALYPGAAYWGGLPQVYVLIFPLTLCLAMALHELAERKERRFTHALSLGMGIGYLAYDLFVFFTPATLLVLAARRRWSDIPFSLWWQLLPLAAWVSWLQFGLGVTPANSNTTVYTSIIQAYWQHGSFASTVSALTILPEVLGDIYFGANFLFLPALCLALLVGAVAGNQPRPALSELALCATMLVVFLFNNLAPDYDSKWPLRGTWIARLYEPILAVNLIWIARCWAAPAGKTWGRARAILCCSALVMNALVVFGPVMSDPVGVSTRAYYRFYNHWFFHEQYRENLENLGRRPLGFPLAKSNVSPTPGPD